MNTETNTVMDTALQQAIWVDGIVEAVTEISGRYHEGATRAEVAEYIGCTPDVPYLDAAESAGLVAYDAPTDRYYVPR